MKRPPSLPVNRPSSSRLQTKHRGMMRLQNLAVPQIHVHAARQTWIEAPYRAHDIDPFKLVRAVFFEDGSILHRVLVWTRSAVNVAWISIPGGRRIRMVVGDLAFLDHHMMREHAANRFVETATNGLLRHFEFRPGFGMSGMQLRKCLFHEVQCGAGSIDLEVGTRPVAFDGVAPLWDLPLELNLRQRGGFRKIHLYAGAGGLDVSDVNQTGQRGSPKASDRSASRVHRQMIARPLVQPARRHHPGVLATEV